jgi:hypothetical protein
MRALSRSFLRGKCRPSQSFSVVSGGSSLTYTWKKNGSPVSGTEYSGQTTATLTINPTATGDSGTYTCVLTGPSSSTWTSTGAALTVNNPCTPPSVGAVTPSSQAVCAGSSASFSVPTPTGTSPFTYQWQVNKGSGYANVSGSEYGATGTAATLVINPTATTDSGSYQCVVTGQCSPAATATAGTLTVNANPTVSVNSQTVCASALPATVTATPAGGTGPYSYAWTVPSGPNPGNVASFSTSVAGSYGVVVTDTHGCTGSGSGALTVNALPTTSAISGSSPVCAGASGVTYSVTATSGSSYAWTVPSGATITAGGSGPNNYQITVTFGSTGGNVAVTETSAAGCAGSQVTKSVTVNPAAATSAISGSGSVAINQLGGVYSVTPTTGSSYVWTVPSDASITAGSGTASITVNFGSASGNVTVTETTSLGCVGTLVSLPVTVGPNHAPVAPAAKSLTTAMNTAATYNKVKLLVGATDADSDTLSVTAASTPAHGTTVLETDDVKYTPTTGYTGSDSYTYTISDGNGGTAIGTVNVIVTSNNGASPNVVGSPTFDSGTGTFSVTFAGIPGVEYTVEYAEGSAAPPWTKLSNVTAGSDGLFTVTDGPGLSDSRYYRTVYPSY